MRKSGVIFLGIAIVGLILGCTPAIDGTDVSEAYSANELARLKALLPVANERLAEALGEARSREIIAGTEDLTKKEAAILDSVAQEVLMAEFGDGWEKFLIVETAIEENDTSRAINIGSKQFLGTDGNLCVASFSVSAVQTCWPFWTYINATGELSISAVNATGASRALSLGAAGGIALVVRNLYLANFPKITMTYSDQVTSTKTNASYDYIVSIAGNTKGGFLPKIPSCNGTLSSGDNFTFSPFSQYYSLYW